MILQPLRLTLVDMNNGVANEAVRCFKRLLEGFTARVKAANPGLEVIQTHVQPRNLGEVVPRDTDLTVSSGGPGSPRDGYEDEWANQYRSYLDHVVDATAKDPVKAPAIFAVCHSFELSVLHFGIATMRQRPSVKFGLMPAYTTPLGMKHAVFEPFADRLFAFEHRGWEAVDLDEVKLARLGGKLLARESREGRQDKGEGLLAFQFAPGILGTQFHPEADRPGVLAWALKPDKASAFKLAYGEALYDRMILSLKDPTRLARTFALMIPRWLALEFNRLAQARGYTPLTMPEEDFQQFEAAS